MGRMRIKKKEAVIPFRETVAYRLLLVVASGVVLAITLYQLLRSVRTQNQFGLIVSALTGAMAVTALTYNLSQMRNARVPDRTLKRMSKRK
jgi:ABC-type Fe3+-siderophore transport system permease subunit